MVKRKRGFTYRQRLQVRFWGTVLILLIVAGISIAERMRADRAAQTQAVSQEGPAPVPDSDTLENVQIVSVYDGDTFKISLGCSLAAYCDKVSVRVRGVDTPEMKGKTAREKELAKKAKAFTKDFLAQAPVTLRNCGRDKYFRLLCDVSNGEGKDLARELIKRDLGYSYEGGKKSDRYK